MNDTGMRDLMLRAALVLLFHSLVSGTSKADSLTVTVNYPSRVCNGESAQVNVSATGGTEPYHFLWSSGDTTSSVTQTAGTYTVVVTDSDSIPDTVSVTVSITESSALALSGSSTPVKCYGGSDGTAEVTAAGGTPPYFYSWYQAGGAAPISNLSQINNKPAGAYHCVITDSLGCTGVVSVDISPAVPLNFNFQAQHVKCFGGSDGSLYLMGIGGAGGYTYYCSNTGTGGSLLSGLSAGTYSITVTDTNGCSISSNVQVTEPSELSVWIGAYYEPTCAAYCNGVAYSGASGGTGSVTFYWSSGSMNIYAYNLCAGLHVVNATDANGCTASDSVFLNSPSPISATATVLKDADCSYSNGIVAAAASGGTGSLYVFNWWTIGIWNYYKTADTVFNVPPGQHSVIIYDANWCWTSVDFTVQNIPGAVAAVDSIVSPSCWNACDGIAHATASGGTYPYSFQWGTDPIQSGDVAGGLCEGVYTVLVTDGKNCTAASTFTVHAPPEIVLTASDDLVLCEGQTTALTANAAGGSGDFTYSWNNGEYSGNQITISAAEADTFVVVATDTGGCSSLPETVFISMGAPVYALVDSAAEVCKGNSVVFTASAIGGSGNYNYTWLPDYKTTQTVSLDPAASQTYTLVADDGCMRDSAEVFVKVKMNPLIIFDSVALVGCEPFCANFNCTVVAGAGDQISSVFLEYGDGTISNSLGDAHCYDTTGMYNVKLTAFSTLGCMSTSVQNNYVTVNPSPVAGFVCDPPFTSENHGEINFHEDAEGGEEYAWDFGDNTQSYDQNPVHVYTEAGQYTATLLVKNKYNCTDTSVEVIDVHRIYTLYIPNSFTPDGNLLNETFRAYGTNLRDFRMVIFDRWGKLVYESDDIEKGWDGKIDDKPAEGGVYAYKIQVSDHSGKRHFYNGHVTLVR